MAKKAINDFGKEVTAEEEVKKPKAITDAINYSCNGKGCGCPVRLVRLSRAPYFAEKTDAHPHIDGCPNNKHRSESQKGSTVVRVVTNDPEEIDINEILEELEMPTVVDTNGGGSGNGGEKKEKGEPNKGNNGPRTITKAKEKIKNALQLYVTILTFGLDALLGCGLVASDVLVNTDNFRCYLDEPHGLEGKKLLVLGKCNGKIAMKLAKTKPEGAIDWTFCLPFRCRDDERIYAHIFFDSWETHKRVIKRIKAANNRNHLVVIMAQWFYEEENGLRVVNALIRGEEQVNVLRPEHFSEINERLRQPYRDAYAK